MNERISRQEVSDALERRLSGLQDDPWLTAKVLSKAEGEKTVKKISATAILVIALLALTMAGALAAALNAWGVIDFAGNLGWTYVPENARDSVTAENLTVETDHLICTIRESYYDGEILRVTADIEPKEKMLLVADDETIMPADNEEDCGVTAVEYAKAHFGSRLGDVYLFPEEMDVDCETEWRSNEDGSVTVYMACFFPDEQAERDAELELGYVPGRDLESLTEEELEEEGLFDTENMERTPVTLKVRAVETESYVCEEPLDFPSAGVQVTRVAMTVSPLEIRYRLYFTVTDLEKYKATEGGLWFEFVNPESTATEYFEQTFEGGLSGGGSIGCVDDEDEFGNEKVGTVLCQTDTLGLNALGEEYTLRAYNCWEKTRYETVTFRVTKVE